MNRLERKHKLGKIEVLLGLEDPTIGQVVEELTRRKIGFSFEIEGDTPQEALGRKLKQQPDEIISDIAEKL